jgi:mannitol/fructose-specific phosphotransferase system IIA component (Ntr-type)
MATVMSGFWQSRRMRRALASDAPSLFAVLRASGGIVEPVATSAAAVIEECLDILVRSGRLPAALRHCCRDGLRTREEHSSTVLSGYAFPHAGVVDLPYGAYILARCPCGIPWRFPDQGEDEREPMPAFLIFLHVFPPEERGKRLHLFAEVSRLVNNLAGADGKREFAAACCTLANVRTRELWDLLRRGPAAPSAVGPQLGAACRTFEVRGSSTRHGADIRALQAAVDRASVATRGESAAAVLRVLSRRVRIGDTSVLQEGEDRWYRFGNPLDLAAADLTSGSSFIVKVDGRAPAQTADLIADALSAVDARSPEGEPIVFVRR